MKDFFKRWWEFFSDSDVKWTAAAVMVMLWMLVIAWLTFQAVLSAPDLGEDQQIEAPR